MCLHRCIVVPMIQTDVISCSNSILRLKYGISQRRLSSCRPFGWFQGGSKSRKSKWMVKVGASNGYTPLIKKNHGWGGFRATRKRPGYATAHHGCFQYSSTCLTRPPSWAATCLVRPRYQCPDRHISTLNYLWAAATCNERTLLPGPVYDRYYCSSLREGTLPDLWKTATIVPVPTKIRPAHWKMTFCLSHLRHYWRK